MNAHTPVLLSEVIHHLQPEPNQVFIDGTVGLGGHAQVLLEHVLPGGRLLAIDRDRENLRASQTRLANYGDSVVFVNDSFANVKQHAYDHKFTHVNGILLDLGFSSVHVDDASRGFSFRDSGPLDMRYDQSQSLTAKEVVATWDEDELARAFREFGEERQARKIAQMIVERRKDTAFETTGDLAHAIELIIPRRGKIHPATKVFQALRIVVNDELGEVKKGLPDLVDLLDTGGRIAIITFHSLEDRIIKRFFRDNELLEVVNKRVIKPSESEVEDNPRARSAKLRVAQKL